MRSPKKRSLLSVNEHFEGERNDKRAFLVSLICKEMNKKMKFKACEDFENRSLVDLNECLQNQA